MQIEKKAQKIVELSKKYEKETVKILSDLIKIPGFNGSEKDVCKYIAKNLKRSGVKVQVDSIGNVIGRLGNGPGVVVFEGHVDTCGIGNKDFWIKNPHSGDFDDNYVYGRGSCDQRGGIAAFLTAARILKKMKLDKELTVYFIASVMKENCGGLSWKYIINDILNERKQKKWKMKKPDLVISTQSTHQENGELAIYNGHRGRIEIEVELIGHMIDPTTPNLTGNGVNAIFLANEFCHYIKELNKKLPSNVLGKGSVEPTRIITSSPELCEVFDTCDKAQVRLNRRLALGETEEIAIAEIEKILYEDMKLKKVVEVKQPPSLEEGKNNDDNKNFVPTGRVFIPDYRSKAYTGMDVMNKKYQPAWMVKENGYEVMTGKKAYNLIFNRNPIIGKYEGITNGCMISGKHEIPCIIFGPGYEKDSHKPNEKYVLFLYSLLLIRCPIIDLVNCSAFYAMYAYSFAKDFSFFNARRRIMRKSLNSQELSKSRRLLLEEQKKGNLGDKNHLASPTSETEEEEGETDDEEGETDDEEESGDEED